MKPELIIKAMQTVISKQDEGAEQRIAGALAALNEAKDAHTASMGKLSDIEASIQRCEQERQTALSESAQAEQDWRSRFRTLRGNLTPELKAEHSKRIASRELADEFTGLITELEKDKNLAMLGACSSGTAYISAHEKAFTTYANSEWKKALTVHIGSESVNTLTMMLDTIDLLAELAQQCASHSHPSVGTPTNAGAFNQTAAKAGQTRSKYQNIIA